jgi:hypothetical protein
MGAAATFGHDRWHGTLTGSRMDMEITLGVDLSTDARRTGLCLLEWGNGPAHIVQLAGSATDEHIFTAARDAGHIAIDVPFG